MWICFHSNGDLLLIICFQQNKCWKIIMICISSMHFFAWWQKCSPWTVEAPFFQCGFLSNTTRFNTKKYSFLINGSIILYGAIGHIHHKTLFHPSSTETCILCFPSIVVLWKHLFYATGTNFGPMIIFASQKESVEAQHEAWCTEQINLI
jgi:hypothetical protein